MIAAMEISNSMQSHKSPVAGLVLREAWRTLVDSHSSAVKKTALMASEVTGLAAMTMELNSALLVAHRQRTDEKNNTKTAGQFKN